MKSILLLLFVFFFNLVAFSQWKNVRSSAVTFKIKNAGIGVDGTFGKVNMKIQVDEANPTASLFSGTVDVASLSTGIKLRDSHLKEKDDFFDIKRFPMLSMRAVNVSVKSAGIFTVTWELTMKGITKRLSSDVIAKKETDALTLFTVLKIDRNDWKIGGNSLTMGDLVTVKITSTVTK